MTLPLFVAAAASVHEHAWITESAHRTSQGIVRYVRCVDCAARRVDLDPATLIPAAPLSRVVG